MRYFPPIFEFIILLALTPSLACAWQVTLNVTGTGTSDQVIFGSEAGSSNGVDAYDVPKSPAPPSPPYTRAYFYHPELTYPYDYMHADYRNTTVVSSFSYNLSLINAIGSPGELRTVTLSWNASSVPSNFSSVLLKDYATDTTTDMRYFSNYTFSMPTDQTYNLYIVLNYTSVASFVLEEGWNLISLPLQPLNSSPTWVFGSVTGYILSRWNPSVLSYAQYHEDVNCSLVECITELIPGYGYWLFTPNITGLSVEGTEITDFSVNISLSEGWNMIGLPFFSIVNFTHLLGFYPNQGLGTMQVKNLTQLEVTNLLLGYLFSYDAQAGSYAPLIDFPSGQIEQKKGYWLPSLSDFDLWIPRSSEWSLNCTGFYPNATVTVPVNVTPSWEPNLPGRYGIVLEETVSDALNQGFANGTAITLNQEVDFLGINPFDFNGSHKMAVESITINPARKSGEEIAKLVYSEENESDPHWHVELGTGFMSYQAKFESQLPSFDDAIQDLYATFTDRVPNIPILGKTAEVYSLNDTHWSVYIGYYQLYDAIGEDDPPVVFTGPTGEWTIDVVDVFNESVDWLANLNVTHKGYYENHTHITEGFHDYDLGGDSLEVFLYLAVGNYASFYVSEGYHLLRNITTGDPWLNNSSWTVVHLSTTNATLLFNQTPSDLVLREGHEATGLHGYLNASLELWSPLRETISFDASPSGSLAVGLSEEAIESVEIYLEFPNLNAAHLITYLEDQPNYLGTGTDANALLLNWSDWKGIVIANKVYAWNITEAGSGRQMELSYRALNRENQLRLSGEPNNSVKNVSVLFHNASSYAGPEENYIYSFYLNGSYVHVFWSNNTSEVPYSPGHVRTRGLGTIRVNTSDNITISYSGNLGQTISFSYDPNAPVPGWKNASGGLLGNGINTAMAEPSPADRQDVDTSGVYYVVAEGTSTLLINSSLEAPKARLIIGEMPSMTIEENRTFGFADTRIDQRGVEIYGLSTLLINPQDYCFPDAYSLDCFVPPYRGEVNLSQTADFGNYMPNIIYPEGILLEENVSFALNEGFYADKSLTLTSEENSFLNNILFEINNTTYAGTEKLEVNPYPHGDPTVLRYYEYNESDPAFLVEIEDGFLRYTLNFDRELPLIENSLQNLSEQPTLKIAGRNVTIFSIHDDYWEVCPEYTAFFDNKPESYEANVSDFTLLVVAIFDDGGGNYYVSITVLYNGSYQSHILPEGDEFTYGTENQFGGPRFTIHLLSVNEPDNDTIDFVACPGSDCLYHLYSGDDWLYDEEWRVLSVNRKNISIENNLFDNYAIYQTNAMLGRYFNITFLGLLEPESTFVSVKHEGEGALSVNFTSVLGQQQISTEDIYFEYPETLVRNCSKCPVKLELNQENYLSGVPGSPGIDASVLRMNESAWEGIVIGDRVFYFDVDYGWPTDDFILCYDEDREICPFLTQTGTVMGVPVPFYDTKTGLLEGTYTYYFMYNYSGNKNIYVFWSNNTSETPYPPGTLHIGGTGSFSFNTSMNAGGTVNSTLWYTDKEGQALFFKYRPNMSSPGWGSSFTGMLCEGIDTENEPTDAISGFVDYTGTGGTRFTVTNTERDILRIEAFLGSPKARFFIGTLGGFPYQTATFNSSEAGVHRQGIALSAFDIANSPLESHCIFNYSYGSGFNYSYYCGPSTFVLTEDDPPVSYCNWSIQATDVFDDGADNWYASLTVNRTTTYQAHVMSIGQVFTFGAQDQFDGYNITIRLNNASNDWANVSIIE